MSYSQQIFPFLNTMFYTLYLSREGGSVIIFFAFLSCTDEKKFGYKNSINCVNSQLIVN